MSTLVQRLSAAALDVGGKLAPDKKNKEQNYDYLSADKILSISGQALFSQGVAVIPQVCHQETTLYEYTDGYGKTKRRYDCTVDFLFTVTDGETEMKLAWVGCGSDYMTPDKALYKAQTSGHKYFLMKLLCIGAGNEDGEHDPNDEEPPARQVQRPANGKQQKQAPTMEQAAKDLGAKATVTMTLETAEEITNAEGVRYGDLDSEKLSKMTIGIDKALKNPNTAPEHADELRMKRDAIAVILSARSEGVTGA